jgi:hypothetical protein
MTHFRQYLQADLENNEEFYKGVVSTFVAEVSSVSELKIKYSQDMLDKKNKESKINVS